MSAPPGEAARVFGAPWRIERFASIDSTNTEAKRRAFAGELDPVWLSADVQTLGRGRLGRGWSSPVGNLSATALFPLGASVATAPLVCFAAGVALFDAAVGCGVDPAAMQLKWPNDLMTGGAKLGGILIETGSVQAGLWVAAGFGVNIVEAPQIEGRIVARLTDLPGGAGVTRDALLSRLDLRFRAEVASLLADSFEPLRGKWMTRGPSLGTRLAVNVGSETVTGDFAGLGGDGALLLDSADGRREVRTGDVSVLG
ncbi:biotin--[acetyl-CoA-carboxylase] ligase [bacterium]|nr:biotin--[acetyl-CoA-carboxylase] ligase [bacterium]